MTGVYQFEISVASVRYLAIDQRPSLNSYAAQKHDRYGQIYILSANEHDGIMILLEFDVRTVLTIPRLGAVMGSQN